MTSSDRRNGRWKWMKTLLVGVLGPFAVGHVMRTMQAPASPPASSSPHAEVSQAVAAVVHETPHVFVPVYHPRPATEWQGMRVDVSHQASCERTELCGLAMVCHNGHCGPCEKDSECAPAEGCVLDHCVPVSNIECRLRADCESPTKICVLSGYSHDPRGNAEMRAYCLDKLGGPEQLRLPPRETKAIAVDSPRTRTLEQRLLEMVGEGSEQAQSR